MTAQQVIVDDVAGKYVGSYAEIGVAADAERKRRNGAGAHNHRPAQHRPSLHRFGQPLSAHRSVNRGPCQGQVYRHYARERRIYVSEQFRGFGQARGHEVREHVRGYYGVFEQIQQNELECGEEHKRQGEQYHNAASRQQGAPYTVESERERKACDGLPQAESEHGGYDCVGNDHRACEPYLQTQPRGAGPLFRMLH